MMKKIKYIVLMLSMAAMLAPATYVHAVTIKIATLSPEGTFWMKQMRAGAEEIKQKTDGRVKFKFYPGGVMGNDESVLRKIRVGQLQGGAITIGNLSKSVPETTVYGLPFLFSDLEQASEVRKESDPMLMSLIEENGFVSFGVAQGGFTYLMSKNLIKGFDDLKNQKSWVPEKSDIGLAVYEYIGVAPISLPLSDVLTGLQTGMINNIITSPIGALALQWYTHVDYVVDLPLNYLTAMMVIDKKVFNKLSEEDQAVLREVMGRVYREIDKQNLTDNIEARKALIKQGVKFTVLTPQEKQEWLKAGDYVIDEMVKKYNYDKVFYDTVMSKRATAPK